MAIKICKSCKKPMKATDTNCRTCGAEYKNNPAFLIAILVVIVCGIAWPAWWYFSQKQIEKKVAHKANVTAYIKVLKNLDLPADKVEIIANLKYSNEATPSKFGFIELKELVSSFNDQRELSNKVMRVALVQPLSELQKIKRNTEAKSYSGCLEASKLIYVNSMNATNEALLTFLADGDEKESEITYLFTKSVAQELEAKKVLDECELAS